MQMDSDMPKRSYKVFSFKWKGCLYTTRRLSGISPAKMFKVNQELQFGSLQPWWVTCKFPHSKEKRTLFKEGEGSWEDYRKQSSLEKLRIWKYKWLFIDRTADSFNWLKSWQERRGSLSSAHWALLSYVVRNLPPVFPVLS